MVKHRRVFKKVIAKYKSKRNIFTLRPNVDKLYVPIYCEGIAYVQTASNSPTLNYTSGLTYHNLASIIGGSNSFINIFADYQRMKITKIEVFVTDCDDASYVAQLYGSVRTLPILATGFYPTRTSADLGNGPTITDDALVTAFGHQSTGRYKSWNCSNKMVDKNSNSVGTWIDPSVYSQLNGQISIGNFITTPAVSASRVFTIRFRVTCVFASKMT